MARLHGSGQLPPSSQTSDVEVDPNLAQAIEQRRSHGQDLPDQLRRDAEAVFDADFDHVQVHTGTHANTFAERLHAEAFTLGGDIFFRDGNYRPTSNSGRELLGHELAHTVQQVKRASTPTQVSNPETANERRARRGGRWFASQGERLGSGVSGGKPADTRSAVTRRDTGGPTADLSPTMSRSGAGPRRTIQRQETEAPEAVQEPIVFAFEKTFSFNNQEFEVEISGRPHSEPAEPAEPRAEIKAEAGRRRTQIKVDNVGKPREFLQSSLAAVDVAGAFRWGPLAFTLDVDILEAKLRGPENISLDLFEVSLRIDGTLTQDQLLDMLRLSVPGEDVRWNVGGTIKTSVSVNARLLQRYLRNLDQIDRATRRLDTVDRNRARYRRERQRLTQELARTHERIQRARNLPPAQQRELLRQWEGLREERARVNQKLRQQNARAQALRTEIRRLGQEAADARRALDRRNPVGRRLRRRVATRAAARLGGRLLAKLIPIVNIASLGYDIYTIGRFLVGVLRGEVKFGGEGPPGGKADEAPEVVGETEADMPPGQQENGEMGEPGRAGEADIPPGREPEDADRPGTGSEPATAEGEDGAREPDHLEIPHPTPGDVRGETEAAEAERAPNVVAPRKYEGTVSTPGARNFKYVSGLPYERARDVLAERDRENMYPITITFESEGRTYYTNIEFKIDAVDVEANRIILESTNDDPLNIAPLGHDPFIIEEETSLSIRF